MTLLLAPLILIAAVLYVAAPLLKDATESTKGSKSRRRDWRIQKAELISMKDDAVSGLKDIEMDYRMGKLSEEDYLSLKSEFEQRAMELLEKIDLMGEDSRRGKKGAGQADRPTAV